jgi:hypothetical protein
MDPIIEEFTITLKYQVTVNTETGEMITKCINRTVDKTNFEVTEEKKPKKKPKKEESSTPELVLEDNKYSLNSAAIELMHLTPDSKLDIKYEKDGKAMVPVIGTDEAFGTKGGNKLTKSNTVACRGSKNEELSKYGSIFCIEPHATKEGLFILTGNIKLAAPPSGDENISVDEVDENLPFDLDLSALDGEDSNVEEVDSSYFQL